MTIEKIISANEKNFEKWDEQLQEHLDLPFHSGVTDPQEASRIFYQTNDLLYAIAQNFITYGKFKDTWDISKCSHNVFGQHLYIKSEKLDINFYWGVDQDTFYIESFVIHPENLRHMTDEFWEMLLELKTIGKLELNCPTLLKPRVTSFYGKQNQFSISIDTKLHAPATRSDEKQSIWRRISSQFRHIGYKMGFQYTLGTTA